MTDELPSRADLEARVASAATALRLRHVTFAMDPFLTACQVQALFHFLEQLGLSREQFEYLTLLAQAEDLERLAREPGKPLLIAPQPKSNGPRP